MDGLVVGDIVTLASGGPPMTVADILPWGEVFCVWFTPDHRCVGEVFDLRIVRKLDAMGSETATPSLPVSKESDPPSTALAAGTPPLGYESVDSGRAGDLMALRQLRDDAAVLAPPARDAPASGRIADPERSEP